MIIPNLSCPLPLGPGNRQFTFHYVSSSIQLVEKGVYQESISYKVPPFFDPFLPAVQYFLTNTIYWI